MRKSVTLILVFILTIGFALYGCAGTVKSNDPTALIVGKWMNEEAGVVTDFQKDGSYTTLQNGQLILSDTYTAKKIDEKTITLTTGAGASMTIVFSDENTMKTDEATMTRMSPDQSSPAGTGQTDDADSINNAKTVLSGLLIGKWTSEEGGLMVFKEGGAASYTQDANTDTVTFKYKVAAIDSSSMTITLTDIDGTESTDTAQFTDNNTLVIGGSTYTRVN